MISFPLLLLLLRQSESIQKEFSPRGFLLLRHIRIPVLNQKENKCRDTWLLWAPEFLTLKKRPAEDWLWRKCQKRYFHFLLSDWLADQSVQQGSWLLLLEWSAEAIPVAAVCVPCACSARKLRGCSQGCGAGWRPPLGQALDVKLATANNKSAHFLLQQCIFPTCEALVVGKCTLSLRIGSLAFSIYIFRAFPVCSAASLLTWSPRSCSELADSTAQSSWLQPSNGLGWRHAY